MTTSEPTDALLNVVHRLEAAGTAYMIVESVAGYFYGRDRFTSDTDIVIDLPADSIEAFLQAFQDGFYCDARMVADSVRTGAMFNVISQGPGGKFDLIPLARDPFDRGVFARKRIEAWHGYPVFVIAPDDLVLSKLRWAKDRLSERQLADIRAIMAMRLFDENDDYFRTWVRRLGVATTLDASREARYVA